MSDPESLIPRICGDLDAGRLRTMPLAPVDGFILSRIDGVSTVGDLAQAMGVALEDVIASLLKLESLRLVELPVGPKPPVAGAKTSSVARGSIPPRPVIPAMVSPPSGALRTSIPTQPQASRTASPQPPPRQPQPTRVPPPPGPGSAPPRSSPAPRSALTAPPPSRASPSSHAAASEPFAPVADLDLPAEHQQQISRIFARLGSIDHYELLGIDRGAEKKAIKRAYFELTAKFHPDRFFRKRLGPFKAQMEEIFGRMTEAHDTLTNAARRTDYDAYIGSVAHTLRIEQMVAETAAEMRRAEEATLGQTVSSIPPPPSTPTFEPEPGIRSGKAAPPPPRSEPDVSFPKESPTAVSARVSTHDLSARLDGRSSPPPDRTPSGNRISIPILEAPGGQSRRDTLARRLTGGARGGSGQFREPVPSLAPSIAYVSSGEAVDSLKRRYEEKVLAARKGQARKYSESGMAALAKGDVVAAANSLRVALTFDAANEELKVVYDQAQRASDKLLSEQYQKQAEYEEKAEKWAEAARSWQRVTRAHEADAKAHERAAFCLVKAAGDLHDAAALAQRAVQLTPNSAPFHLTLANVYLAAGLTLNAKRELETAAQLAPGDAAVASLLKRIGKSD